MQNVRKLFFTTIALTLTSFLMKTIGVWFNVYLTKLVGSVGMGIFQLVLSVYALSKTLAYGGMNLAATRLCIDDIQHKRHSMKRVLFCSFILGIFAMSLLFFLSDFLSKSWIMTEKASLSLKILSFSLPFVSLSAALNGYMTAARKMNRYSLIQLAEQIAKIGITILIVGNAPFLNTELAIALVCTAITASEVISFSLAMFSYLGDIKKEKPTKKGKKGFAKRMLRLAVPDALGSYIRSALNTIEHLLIPRGIKKSGSSVDKAFSDYGIIQGMALPVILYPSSILGVVSGLLVPEIAECQIKKNEIQKNYIINRVLSTAMIFSMITTSVMIVFAKELSFAIYKTREAELFILQIAPLIPIMYLDMTTDGMLKGLDKQLDIMKINIIDSVLCVVLVALLVPKIAVEGYVITIYVAEIINFLLSFYKLIHSAQVRFTFLKNFLKPLASSFFACLVVKKTLFCFHADIPIFLLIVFSVIFYLFILFIFGGITKEEIRWFSGIIYRKKQKSTDF